MRPVVPPDGPPKARLIIVGARPGASEVDSGRPFTGPSGSLLWNLLSKLGIHRTECYVTNVRKDFSKKNPTPTKEEIHEAIPELASELASISSNIIVALGGEALYALTGKNSITNYRGSILPAREAFSSRKTISTYHPAATLHTTEGGFQAYNLRWLIQCDLRRAIAQSTSPDINKLSRSFIINPSRIEAVEAVSALEGDLSVDIETFGDHISCLAISDSPTRAVCIPIIGGQLNPTELLPVIRALERKLRSSRIIGQNIQFDTTRLENYGFRLPHIYWDTMLWHHLRWTELGSATKRKAGLDTNVDSLTGKHDLGFIVSMYCNGEPYYKDTSEWAWTSPELTLGDRFWWYWWYNCMDAACTYEAYEKQLVEAREWNQLDYFQNHVVSMIRPVMATQSLGMRVDQNALSSERKRLHLEQAVLQERLNHDPRVGMHINVKSPIDLARLLDKLNWRNIRRTKTGKYKTDKDTLLDYAYQSEDADLFRLILEIRARRTLESNFLSLTLDDDGRYKAAYLIHGTDSGRLSSRAFRQGPQLQNIPERTRKIFVPAVGMCFVSRDLAKAEAMFVAYDSEDPDLISIFEDESRDLYKEVAAMALDIPISSVQPWQRQIFKQVVHAANYGMGWKRFISVCRVRGINVGDLPVLGHSAASKAKYILDTYHHRFPSIRLRQERITDEIRATRTILGTLGRKRVFLGPIIGKEAYDTFKAAFSYDPQHVVVSITNNAWRTLHNQKYNVVAQVHDSIMVEVPISERYNAAKDMQAALTHPINVRGRIMTIRSDCKWSAKSWGHMEELK